VTMNLSGNLGSFGLDEVLSLLAMGGRTARMHVTGPHALGVVHLVAGEVSSASSDVRRAGLLRQVVAAGEVPVGDLAAALDGEDPVRALLESGVVDADRVRGLADESIVDALAEMLAWHDGQFAVWTGDADPGDVGVRMPVAHALDRARERADAWTRVREALPGDDAVLSLAPDVAEPTTLDVEDWSVLARVDGRRTLAEVLAAVGVAPLVASDRLVGLMARGVVRVRPDEVAEPNEVAELLERYEAGGPEPQPDPEPVPLLVVVEEEQHAEPPEPVELWSAQAAHDGLVEERAAEVVAAELIVPAEVAAFLDPVGTWSEDGATEPVEEPVGLAEPVGFAEPAALAEPVEEPAVIVEPVEFELVGSEEPAAFVEPVEALVVVEPGLPAEVAAFVDGVPAEAAAFAEPVAFAVAPVAFADPVEPIGFTEEPVAFADPVEVVAFADPVAATPSLAPLADGVPVAPAVQWSPWAQALGLGAPAPEGELVVDPLAGPGIAEMIAGAHGLADVEHVLVPPVPMAPDTGLVPGPRLPEVETWAAEAAVDPGEDVEEAPMTPVPVADDAAAALVAADPLQPGLLAQLMPGMRGQ
jgi:hypothetical protein